jgi:glycerol-3-phosphate dehydrogenase
MPTASNSQPIGPVLILGGGIHGAAVARELALNGVPVVLVEANDLAAGATSKSSRLVHGGLRYLEYGDVGLVRESLIERRRLLDLAPHLVRPLRLFVPTSQRWSGLLRSALGFFKLARTRLGRWLLSRSERRAPRGYWPVRIGLWMYDLFSWGDGLPKSRGAAVEGRKLSSSTLDSSRSGGRKPPGSSTEDSQEPGGLRLPLRKRPDGQESLPPNVDPARYRWMSEYSDAQMLYPERCVFDLLADAEQAARERGVPFRVVPHATLEWCGAAVTSTASLVPSPPSSGERVRVRGPSGEDGLSNSIDVPQQSSPSSKSLDSPAPPHPNPLPPKSGGEGTKQEAKTEEPSTKPEEPLTLTLSPQSRGEGTTVELSPQSRGEGTTVELSPQSREKGTRVELPLAAKPSFTVTPALIVNVSGAWGDITLKGIDAGTTPLFAGTKGSHFITRHPALKSALGDGGVYAETADRRLCFVLPFGDAVLVGTTDERWAGPPDEAVASDAELDYLLSLVQTVFGLTLSRLDIAAHYSGVRPLPRTTDTSNAAVSRDHSLADHRLHGIPIVTLVGGKLTTFRAVGEQIADRVFQQLGLTRQTSTRDRMFVGGDGFPRKSSDWPKLWQQWAADYGTTVDEARDLGPLYGMRTRDILFTVASQPPAVVADTPFTMRVVCWVIEHEWVTTLDDLIERRLMLVFAPVLSLATLHDLAECLVATGRLSADAVPAAIESTRERLRVHYGRVVD